MVKQTLVLIKPDVIEKDVWFEIMQVYLNNGLKICRAKILNIEENLAQKFYAEHEEKPFFQELVDHMTSGPTIALIVSGENAIKKVRELNGATNPAEAREGTIRHKYGEPNGGTKNAVHGSDSKENAKREIITIFGKNAL